MKGEGTLDRRGEEGGREGRRETDGAGRDRGSDGSARNMKMFLVAIPGLYVISCLFL